MSKIDNVVRSIKNGIPVIIVDDYDRENEGDLVISATQATKHNLLFCMNRGRGLMCIPCMQPTLDRLQIPMMNRNNKDKFGTPFTVSVDAVEGTTSGMSVYDRLKTVQVMSNPNSTPDQLAQPGHLFPLRANPDLLLGRRGHTESSIELMRLSKEPEISVIVEIMDHSGLMTRGDALMDFAKVYNLEVISVEEIYEQVYKKSV